MHSSYFKAMFETRMREESSNEVEIKECRLPVFRQVLRFLYGGKVQLSEGTCQEVLMIAERFQIEQLKGLAEEYLCNVLEPENAIQMRSLAEHANAPGLKRACTNFILTHLHAVLAYSLVPKPSQLAAASSMPSTDICDEVSPDAPVSFAVKHALEQLFGHLGRPGAGRGPLVV